ncbi:coiled-coil domain-containing protein [Sphingobium fuliginis]|uniref:Uncharacterized protein n=1 Tax=Sphingobium fuliginis (strain ATCC 27551) TaxID=336203 RepID=A0ABQ1EU07_SPHSA|nr:AIM24 family protein [Sphingobium fuliginis]RYL99649.1 hypothetical protein EWH10_07265 [Sphingobium fuliginis]GFZ86259.1 hypothetical protein GCM10019071_14550 [Sphingobium fuliginis]
MISKIFGWLGRKVVLYVAVLAAMLAYVVWSSGDIQATWTRSQTLNLHQAGQLQGLVEADERLRDELALKLKRAGEAAQRESVVELEKQIRETQAGLRQLQADRPSSLDAMLAKATLNIKAIRAEHERILRIAFLKRKIEGLNKAADAARNYDAALEISRENARKAETKISREREVSTQALEDSWRKMNVGQAKCRATKAAVIKFDESWEAVTLERLPFRHRRADLVRTKDAQCADSRKAEDAFRQAQKNVNYWRQARAGADQLPKRVSDWIDNELPDITGALKERVIDEQKRAEETISAWATWAWTHYNVGKVVKVALATLGLIITTPFLIRLFCYFVLAPIAMRRPSIQLRVPEGGGVAIAPAAPSATSVAVRLAPGQELLVRQGYFQTSSLTTKPKTKWVLNWCRLFTSIATGLTFLVRIRGEGETTTISAIRDGLTEITILTLPEGAACVLQPRALAAVAQSIHRPLRISRHWRLGSLNAWLTLQLRYLVFHGPAQLVLKGGRGVRVEAAEHGRVFGQDQLVGFSDDLAYSVTRTEPFWPYFFGQQPLLKDRVMAGTGVLIIEEAPLTARRGEVRRGLEGMIDAGMKVFGM